MKLSKCIRALVGALLYAQSTFACGPDFPNSFLISGDSSLFTAPIASFCQELHRIDVAKPAFSANPATNGHVAQSIELELQDLRRALSNSGVSPRERDVILRQHREEREKLGRKLRSTTRSEEFEDEPRPEPIKVEEAKVVSGLPDEFANYFRGLLLYHNGKTNEARVSWNKVLGLEASERKFRSTWAAYMLGRSWGDDPKAIPRFQQVRQLARDGYVDSLGLSAASLGWEARVHFKAGQYAESIDLYLAQLATGDDTALNSLQWVAAKALGADIETLQKLARNTKSQRVLTAYLISRSHYSYDAGDPYSEVTRPWLEAVESVGIRDLASAERLALAAYQTGEMEAAKRWLKVSGASPLSQWLGAKLLLREGKAKEAATLLAQISKDFPTSVADSEHSKRIEDDLYLQHGEYDATAAGQQIRGEMGALHLARREYVQALDALVRAGFWMDGAWVAESVLTVDELKMYVDRNWPETKKPGKEGEDNTATVDSASRDIRHLLARRLTRLNRGNEAREYYPEELHENFDQLATALRKGWDQSLPPDQRAAQLWQAAQTARANGLQLLGTELAPDYFLYDGNFEHGPSLQERTNAERNVVLRMSPDELRRAQAHAADPDSRFHYRYVAADLAWHAAELMPNDSEFTAVVLCRAGTWIKYLDPQAADRYYKALVRRCRHTEIGAEADRMRWFPSLDAENKIVKQTAESSTDAEPEVVEPAIIEN